MPLLIPTFELQPGMALREALVADGRVMMRGGRELTRQDVDVLRRRYPRTRVRVGDPVLDSVVEFEDDTRERELAEEAQRQVAQCMREVHARFADRAAVAHVQVGRLQRTVRDLTDLIKSHPLAAAIVPNCVEPDHYLALHAGNVFYLTMLLAHRVLDYVISERRRQTRARDLRRDFANDLVPLGLGAMVMDVGLVRLSRLLRRDQALTAGEDEALRCHPLDGVKLLPEGTSPLARMIVRTHHENAAGTGYPRERAAARLHVFSRLVRIADAYDAATSREVFRGARSPARVLWEMTAGPLQGFYDARLAAAFGTLIQPFPIGTKLRLTDGRYAAVVRFNRTQPFDPCVIVCFDAHNRPLPRQRLEGPLYLSARSDLRIAALGDEDLSYIYTRAPPQTHLSRPRFTTPLEAFYP